MVGVVISDSFLLCGVIDTDGDSRLKSIVQIPFNFPISSIINDEAELNSLLGFSLRKATESHPFDGHQVSVVLLDEFIQHSAMKTESGLMKDDYQDYQIWKEAQKDYNQNNNQLLFGQSYLPDEASIHFCSAPQALIRVLELTIPELGGLPHWMGPASSLFLDGSGITEAAVIYRQGNRYQFLKVQDNRFDIGKVAFVSGAPKVISTTDDSEEITLAALGLEESHLDDIPVFCPQKLGRQALNAWDSTDLRLMTPFDGINTNEVSLSGIPDFEANIFTQLVKCSSLNHSMNFFNEPAVTEFFFKDVIQSDPEIPMESRVEEDVIVKKEEKPSFTVGIAIGLILISFIGLFYLKEAEIRETIKGFTITRSSVEPVETTTETIEKRASINLLKQSRAISAALLSLLTQTEIDRYNALTISKSFLSLEYLSGENPNIETLLGIDPTSFSVEATGQDSTVFSWYYSFDLPPTIGDMSDGELNKLELMVQLDTLVNDYSIKYFEQVFTENQIYGPMLIQVKTKADILQASSIISNIGNQIVLRKFVLKNNANRPNPIAGYYISILED